MERAGFFLTAAAGFFSIFLLVWQGMEGASADWVYGFLAVFWALLMMLRLMTLTEPAKLVEGTEHLAQKIMGSYHEWREERAQKTLEISFGGSYFLFACGTVIFAAWQIYCATFPASEPSLSAMAVQLGGFFETAQEPALAQGFFFEWGQGFMLLLSFLLMAFVFRSHAADRVMTRPALLVLCMYAFAGLVTFAGLEGAAKDAVIMQAGLTGSGRGSIPYLTGLIPDGKALSLFDMVLLESGIVGLAVLAFIAFVPLGFIALAAQNARSDKMVVCCGLVTGTVLILSVFLSFTPALGGLMMLCWMAIFLAWGHAESTLKASA